MAFLVRRLLLTLPILFIVSVICFSMINLIPGDPATVILGPEATEQAKEQMRDRLNLNDPIPVQYLDWLGGVLRGDLGESLIDDEPVSTIILQRLPVTIELALGTFAVSLTIAVIAGILSASRRGTWVDYVSTGIALGGISIPHFWLGMSSRQPNPGQPFSRIRRPHAKCTRPATSPASARRPSLTRSTRKIMRHQDNAVASGL